MIRSIVRTYREATLVAARGEGASQGRYQGLFSLSFALAMAVGPALGTSVYGRLGADVVWYLCLAAGPVMGAGLMAFDRWTLGSER